MMLRAVFQWRGGRSASWQLFGVTLAWLYIVGLHLGNDGLWYQWDAPRHAANGLFWWDFLANFPVNPKEFALSYYARYPVINPAWHPPAFYLLEGVAFWLFGASPFVAKGLVLAFALSASFYMTAWLRRWVSKEAGWGGILLVLQPGVISWSHVVLLNIPSMAMSLALLYHAKRWLEAPTSRHFYTAVVLAILGTLTYFTVSLLAFVILGWIVAERRWIILRQRRVLILILLTVFMALLLVLMVAKWTPRQLAIFSPSSLQVLSLAHWGFYLERLPRVLGVSILGLGLLGIVVGLCDRHWRREVKLGLIWGVVCYSTLSYMWAREARYALVLVPPIVVLGVMGLFLLTSWWAARVGASPSRCFLGGMAGLVALHLATAPIARVPAVEGFHEIITFFEKEAPTGRIFYDGEYSSIFAFYLRAGDPQFARGVVRGDKLLYTSTFNSSWHLNEHWHLIERVSSAADVVEILRTECGCQWLAIEREVPPKEPATAQYLRQAVIGPEFQFVRAFPVRSPSVSRVDVYRFLPPYETPNELRIPLAPIMGYGPVLRATPIER